MFSRILYYFLYSVVVLIIIHYIRYYLENIGIITSIPKPKLNETNTVQYRELLEEIKKVSKPSETAILDSGLNEFIDTL